jgi:hypothetical protein
MSDQLLHNLRNRKVYTLEQQRAIDLQNLTHSLITDLHKRDDDNESEIFEELNNAAGLANDLQEKLKIDSQVINDNVGEQKGAIERADENHKSQDEFKLTRSDIAPSAPLRDSTPDENDSQQLLQANARKHSSANNAAEENHDQVFSLRPLYLTLTGEPQAGPTAIKTPVYHLLPTSEKSNTKSTPDQEAKDGLNHTEYHPISNTHTLCKKTTKFEIAIPTYEQS